MKNLEVIVAAQLMPSGVFEEVKDLIISWMQTAVDIANKERKKKGIVEFATISHATSRNTLGTWQSVRQQIEFLPAMLQEHERQKSD